VLGRSSSSRSTALVGAVGRTIVVVAQAARLPREGTLAVMAALLVVDVVALRWATSPDRATRALDEDATVQVLAVLWVAMALFGLHNLSHRPSGSVVTEASAQTAVELALFGGAAVVAAVLLRTRYPTLRLPLPMLAFPVWVVASATWSATPLFALARGAQYVALAVLATATAGLAVRSTDLLDRLVWKVLRGIVWCTVTLIVLGLLLGPIYVLTGSYNRDRFTWIGAHPGSSGLLLGAALLILLAAPRGRLGVAPVVRVGLIAAVGVALYQNQTRTVLAGLVLGAAFLLLLEVRRRPGTGGLLAVYATGAVALVGLLASGAVSTYVLRGGDSGSITSLNGRTQLWGIGTGALEGVTGWLGGLGFGASRTLFVDDFRFATSAHSSALGLLVNVGLIGLGLMVAILVGTVVAAWRGRLVGEVDHGPALACLLIYVVLAAVTSENLAEPTFGTVLLYLIATVAVARSTRPHLGVATTASGDEAPAVPLPARH
jgi:hypothetical protein